MTPEQIEYMKDVYWQEHEKLEKEFHKRMHDFAIKHNINEQDERWLINEMDYIQDKREEMVSALNTYNHFRRMME